MEDLHINQAWLVALMLTGAFALVYPVVAGIFALVRLHGHWTILLFGALVFLVSQVVIRIPIIVLIRPHIAGWVSTNTINTTLYLLILTFTAGLMEEGGRYLGYRFLVRPQQREWHQGITFGIGHGGIESILLVGFGNILTAVNLLALQAIGTASLPSSARQAVVQQIATINAQPEWLPLLGAWERLWTLPIQVAFSIMVLQVFRRGQLRWLAFAILAHMLVDLIGAGLPVWFGATTGVQLLDEVLIALMGVGAIVFVLQQRSHTAEKEAVQNGSTRS